MINHTRLLTDDDILVKDAIEIRTKLQLESKRKNYKIGSIRARNKIMKKRFIDIE